MKKNLLFIVAGFSVVNAAAQSFDYLETSKIKARINTGGQLFNNPIGGPGFEVPKGSGNHSVYYTNLWIGGEDGASALHLAAQNGDFNYGPLVPTLATASPTPAIWNRLWKVTAADINFHIANYTTGGYVPSPAIADWPGYGNPAYPMSTNITPFFDNNSDNLYNPMDGDYPLIKGTTAIYQIYNDDIVHSSGTVKLGVEIHCMAYVFDCADDSVLSNTIFVNYKILNQSTQTYYNTFMGLFADMDLGNYADDYVGSDVSRGMFYTYNGDSFDNPVGPTQNYDSILPIQGVVVLGGLWRNTDSIDNPQTSIFPDVLDSAGIIYNASGLGYDDGIVDNERYGMTSFHPFTGGIGSTQYYNALKGLDASGLPFYYNATTILNNFSYADNTDPLYWATAGTTVAGNENELTVGNIPGDRRGFGSIGSVILNPGQYNEIDLAFIYACDYTSFNNNLAALPILNQRADSIHSYYNSGTSPCGPFTFNAIDELNSTEEISFDVYPNPVSDQLTITVAEFDAKSSYTIFDVVGNVIFSNKLAGKTIIVDVSGLSNGVYFISLRNEKYQTAKKVVVSHR